MSEIGPAGRGVHMARSSGLFPPISRIDIDAARDFFGEEVLIDELPQRIVDSYNATKGVTTYSCEGNASFDGCRLSVYRNITARPRPNPWAGFYRPSGITVAELQTQTNHFVGFIVLGDELYVHTGGHASVVFERFTDVSFPIEVARRIASPEVKRARSSQLSGSTLVSDVNFRDPRRITYTESLQNVWTALGGQVRPEALADPGLRAVFGAKQKMRLDVGGALRFGPRVEALDKLIALLRWLSAIVESPLPSEDDWAFLDSIKMLNPRKSRDLIARLNRHLAKKLVVDRDYANIAVTHTDASLYANATLYTVSYGENVLYRGDRRPEVSDILHHAGQGDVEPETLLTAITVQSQCQDYGPDVGTVGTLLAHLHGEVRHDDRSYFLLAGKWYEVDASYLELVTSDFLGLIEELDLPAAAVGLRPWLKAEGERSYNQTAVKGRFVVNGDRVLTDRVELFDILTWDDERTYVVHVKRDFDVKVRDVRSQIVNSAHIIENDLRMGEPIRLKRHYQRLKHRKRTSMTEAEFLELFRRPRTYVVAYGTDIKVERATLDRYQSMVARMELVALNGQFRQLTSASHATELRIAWVEVV